MKNQSFKIHELNGQIQKIFIAEYKNKILILDGGCRSDAKRIEDYITTTLKRDMHDVKLLIITHIHPDHAGGAPILRKKYNIPIAAPYNINSWYAGPTGLIQHIIDVFLAWIVVIRKKSAYKRFWYNRDIVFDFPLHDQDEIPLFKDWTAIHAPGHTTHDIILYNKKNGILYAADVILTINGRYMMPFPVTLPELMEKSLLKISQLKIKKLLMAHGGLHSISNISKITDLLIPELSKKKTIIYRLVKLITRFSPEIQKTYKDL